MTEQLLTAEPAEGDRDEVLAAVLLFARTWANPKHGDGPAARLADLSRLAGVLALARARLLGEPPPALHWLVDRLERPLSELLPEPLQSAGDEQIAVLDAGRLSSSAEDLLSELAPPRWAVDHTAADWAWLRAELVERRLFESLVAADQATYASARQFLIEQPTGTERTFADGWNQLGWRPPAGSVVEVPAWARLHSWWWPCLLCRWPLEVRQTGAAAELACRYGPHARSGARYRIADCSPPGPRRAGVEQAPVALPLGRQPVPAARRVEGHKVLEQAVWRYITVPGLAELALATALREKGFAVELWPDLDRVDLTVRGRGQVWDVDVKDWTSPVSLARSLRRRHPGTAPDFWLVVPSHRRNQVAELRRLLPGWRIAPATHFVRTVAAVTAREAT